MNHRLSMNRINVICLGVRNVEKSRAFYRNCLGFETPFDEENPDIVFFNNAGTRLELYERQALAADIDEKNPPALGEGFGGITLAYNAKSQHEVNEIFDQVEGMGGRIAKKPQRVFWGGYSGYFQDPDGYYWEVAYWEGWKFDDNDMLVIEKLE